MPLTRACRVQVGDLTEADLKGKKVLVRCDLNVPLDGKTITDGAPPRASLARARRLRLGLPPRGARDRCAVS